MNCDRVINRSMVKVGSYQIRSIHNRSEQDYPELPKDYQLYRSTDLYFVTQNHRWGNYPWLWTDIDTPHTEYLGTINHMMTPENDRAIRSLSLLNEGKIEEALGLYGVTITSELHQLIGGQIVPAYYCDRTWTDLLVETLRQSAPWKLPQAVIDEAERFNLWVSQKKSRQPRPPFLKLAIFPNQLWNTRKTCLILTGNIDGSNPQLIIENTGIHSRLHHTAWKRSISVDFARYGIAIGTD